MSGLGVPSSTIRSRFLLAALACGACGPGEAPITPGGESHARLNALRDRVAEAERVGDVETLAASYTDDIIFQNPWTAPVVGREPVTAVMGQLLSGARFETDYTSLESGVTGDSAIDRGIVVQRVTPEDGSETQVDTLSYLWRVRYCQKLWIGARA